MTHRNVMVLRELGIYAIEDIVDAIEERKKTLDDYEPIYREFEAVYNDRLTTNRLKEAIGARLTGELASWFNAFLEREKEKSGTELGDAFRVDFNRELGSRVGEKVRQTVEASSNAVSKTLSGFARAYEAQLSAFADSPGNEGASSESAIGGAAPGGSLGGVQSKNE